jgi:steroid 5-alpha reductase family enzyme
MGRAFAACAVAYGVAAAVAAGFGTAIGWEHPIAVAFGADVAATLVVFGFSRANDNSSFYDPYWSLAPIPIAVYWAIAAETPAVNPVRQVLVVALVALWGVRLTFNWGRGWKGLDHEDWRYVDLREKHPRTYWWVSAFGLHLLPTLIVFAGCLPLYPALATATAPVGPLDALAAMVTGGAIWIEARADKQLRRFVTSQPAPDAILSDGLWSLCRHPNYFGEMGFWWGLALFGLAADPSWWWTGIGALAITLMFRFVSLPLIEDRMLERRPQFAAHAERTSMVVPWFPS